MFFISYKYTGKTEAEVNIEVNILNILLTSVASDSNLIIYKLLIYSCKKAN